MLRSEVNIFLQKIHSDLKVNRHSNRGEHLYHGGNDAVYFSNEYICAIPPGNLYRYGTFKYTDIRKRKHRSLEGLMNQLRKKIIPHKIREAYYEYRTNRSIYSH